MRPARDGWSGLAGRVGAGAVLLIALAISVAPAVYMLSMSLMDNPQLFAGRIIAWPLRPENYPQAWVASDIGRLYGNSIVVSTASTVLTLAISALAGYGLGRIRFAGRGMVYALVLVGLTIPVQIALIPLFINLRSLGLLNTRLALIGPYTGFGLAFGTYIMKGFFEGLPRELERRPGSTGRASSRSSGA
jgi:raffinose/stachyose/melibiose transport system permease protein